MTNPSSWFDRLIAPRALLLGVAVAFLGCCLAGFVTSRRNHFTHFDRFHQLMRDHLRRYVTGRLLEDCRRRCIAANTYDPYGPLRRYLDSKWKPKVSGSPATSLKYVSFC